MLGDGHLVKNKYGKGVGYSLRLEVTSTAFADKFAACLAILTKGRKPWMKQYTYTKKANAKIGMPQVDCTTWIVVKGSREWYEKIYPVKQGKDYKLLAGKSEAFRHGFLDGIVDAEGYLHPTGSTDVANQDIGLLNVTADFARSLGFKCFITGPYPYSRGVAHLRITAVVV